MKRYDFNDRCDGDSGSCLEDMEESVNGEWVLYADHLAECERMVREAVFLTHEHCVIKGACLQESDEDCIVSKVMGNEK